MRGDHEVIATVWNNAATACRGARSLLTREAGQLDSIGECQKANALRGALETLLTIEVQALRKFQIMSGDHSK